MDILILICIIVGFILMVKSDGSSKLDNMEKDSEKDSKKDLEMVSIDETPIIEVKNFESIEKPIEKPIKENTKKQKKTSKNLKTSKSVEVKPVKKRGRPSKKA